MAAIGTLNTLTVTRQVAFGIYLDGGALGEILLPRLEVPAGTEIGSALEVFLYHDSEDRPIATTRTPRAQVGQCVSLRCVQVNHAGGFLDWGLPKDLLVPFGEQRVPMREESAYVVSVYLDKPSGRVAASTKLDNWLNEDGSCFAPMQPVNLLIWARTDMGWKARRSRALCAACAKMAAWICACNCRGRKCATSWPTRSWPSWPRTMAGPPCATTAPRKTFTLFTK
jgi:predicted RNA-binding protein (virulence factor B family)